MSWNVSVAVAIVATLVVLLFFCICICICKGGILYLLGRDSASAREISPRTAGIAIGSRVRVINIEGMDMWLVQEWRSPSVSSPKGALGSPNSFRGRPVFYPKGALGSPNSFRGRPGLCFFPKRALGEPQGSLREALGEPLREASGEP